MSRNSLSLKTMLSLIWHDASPGSRRFAAGAFGAFMGLLTWMVTTGRL